MTNTFTAPQGTVLAAQTKYFVFIEGRHTSTGLGQTSDDGEDTDSADGWTIADSRLWRSADAGPWQTSTSALRLAVRGSPRVETTPTITDIEVTSEAGVDDTYGISDTVDVTVRFSEAISVDTSGGAPQLTLNVGTGTKTLDCAAHATALTNLVCSYEVAENDAADTDGISIGANSLTLNSATITYRGGTTSADLDHAGVPSNPGHKVNGDPTVPTITSIAFTSSPSFSSDTYGEDEMIEFSLIFSHVVWVTGTPLAQMNVGGVYPRIPLYAGSGTNTLRFRYTVLSGDSDNNGVSIVLHTLAPGGTLSGGIDADPAGSATIQTSAGVNATIRNDATGTTGHKVDGSMRSGMTVPNAPTAVTATPDGADAIHIAWTAPTFAGSSAITLYWIDRSRTGRTLWTLVGSSATSPFSDTGLDSAATYQYQVFAENDSGDGTPSGTVSATTAADLVCGRTSAIADAITAAARVASCKKVTATQLGEITSLDASDGNMTSLAGGDLSGLSSLTMLDLSGNAFTSIPSGLFAVPANLESLDLSSALASLPESNLSRLFANLTLTTLDLRSNGWSVLPEGILTGLSNLATLDLSGNTVDPLPVIVTLERVGRAEFKAAIPAGAPFAAAVPVTVTGGTLVGTPATVTVPAGERDSGTRTVTPSNPRSGAVEVTVGALPAIPSGHSGYVLEASPDLPLTVVSAPATVTIEAETGQVLANAWDFANFTLTRSPVSGSIDVDVAITESDTVLSAGPITVTVTFNENEATAMVPRLLLIGTPSGDATITATVQDGTDHTAGDPGTATLDVKHIDPAMDVTITEETVTVVEGQTAMAEVVATASEGVNRPSGDRPIAITFATRRGTGGTDVDDYAGFSNEVEFAPTDFSLNDDGRWTATKMFEVETLDDAEYEGNETFGMVLERAAALPGTITINGSASGSETATVTMTDNEPPPPPTNVSAESRNAAEIGVSWDAPALLGDDEITGYKVEWSATGGDPWTAAVEDTGTTDTSYIHTGLTEETTYFYRVFASNAHGTSEPSGLVSASTREDLVCERTPEIRDWIVRSVDDASDCSEVTEEGLQTITRTHARLGLLDRGITGLKPGDFAGLGHIDTLSLSENPLTELGDGVFVGLSGVTNLSITENTALARISSGGLNGLESVKFVSFTLNALEELPKGIFSNRKKLERILFPGNKLTRLDQDIFAGLNRLNRIALDDNDLTELPEGLLRGLTQLSWLKLAGNPGAPFSFTVALEKVGKNSIKVVVPMGAPFRLEVPVILTNGNVGGETTVTIVVRTGRLESEPVAISRDAGTSAAITATLGTLPTPPNNHDGYALAAQSTTALQVAPEATIPGTPTDLTAQPDGPNEIVLAWTAPEDDVTAPITGYRIEVSTDGETWTVAVTNTASTDTTYMHARRVAGTTYYYRVRAVNAAGPGAASNEASAMTTAFSEVCNRTPAVVIEIEQATATDCSLVSANQLAAITEIDLVTHAPTTLLSGDFGGMSGLTTLDLGWGLSALPADLLAGLTSLTSITARSGSIATLPSSLFAGRHTLTTIDLYDNPISSLPDGIFAGLAQLGTLDVSPTGDGVTLPLTVELRKVDDGKLRAVVPAGAPFDMVLPITVTNGALPQGTTSVTVPAGTFESANIEVVREGTSHEAVTVNLGTFPTLPDDHAGYALTADEALPLEVLPAEGASILDLIVTTTRGPFGIDDEIAITVSFDKNVTVDTTDGTPYVEILVGRPTKQAGYVSGSGTNQLRFQYTVQAGDSDTDGISIAVNALKTNSGTILSGDFEPNLAHRAVPTIPPPPSTASSRRCSARPSTTHS